MTLVVELLAVPLLGVRNPFESILGSSFPSQIPLCGRCGLCDLIGDLLRGGINGLLRVGEAALKDARLGDPAIPTCAHCGAGAVGRSASWASDGSPAE